MRRDDYRWYGEKPFPWAVLAWPFLWLYGTLRDWRKPKVAPVTQPTIRLYDKEWNLIGTHTGNGPMYGTVDIAGQRWAGRIELVPEFEYLEKIMVSPNPFISGIDYHGREHG